jgi:hypothetical protein
MKNILPVLFILLFAAGCNNAAEKGTDTTENATEDAIRLTVDNVLSSPAEYVGKEVTIEGMVTHVCKHGGQKLFIINEDPEKQLRITVGENIPEFDVALEGSTVEFHGVVMMMEEEEAAAMQQDNAGKDHHTGEEAHAKAENASYYVEAIAFKEKQSTGI